MATESVTGVAARIRRAFEHDPALRLTVREAVQRWQLEPSTAVAVLEALVWSGVLRQTAHGIFVRRHPPAATAGGPSGPSRPGRATPG